MYTTPQLDIAVRELRHKVNHRVTTDTFNALMQEVVALPKNVKVEFNAFYDGSVITLNSLTIGLTKDWVTE